MIIQYTYDTMRRLQQNIIWLFEIFICNEVEANVAKKKNEKTTTILL